MGTDRICLGRSYSVSDVARRYGTGTDKIRAFIANKELVAINIATSGAKRPRWRVTAESLAAFEASRSSTPTTPAKAPPRPRRAQAGVKIYF